MMPLPKPQRAPSVQADARNRVLEIRNTILEAQNRDLNNENRDLDNENHDLRLENRNLEEEIADLRRELQAHQSLVRFEREAHRREEVRLTYQVVSERAAHLRTIQTSEENADRAAARIAHFELTVKFLDEAGNVQEQDQVGPLDGPNPEQRRLWAKLSRPDDDEDLETFLRLRRPDGDEDLETVLRLSRADADEDPETVLSTPTLP